MVAGGARKILPLRDCLNVCPSQAPCGSGGAGWSVRKIVRVLFKVIFGSHSLAAGAALVLSYWLFTSELLNPTPDLKRLFEQSQAVVDQPPVVFIHGVLGSRLVDPETGEEGWFRSPWQILLGEYQHLALEIDPETLQTLPNRYQPSALAGNIIGKDFYGNIIKTIDEYGGYQLAQPGAAADPRAKNYYIFLYDWREDNLCSVRKLADLIDQIRVDYQDPDLKVDIIAHSMGGLIARYYLRYGREDVLDSDAFPINMYGGDRVRRVILLGTPNLGSVEMLHAFIGGIRLGFRRISSETLATMPSLYQLLPHPINDWVVTAQGKSLQRDLFSVRTWRRFQWSVFDPKVQANIHAQFDDAEEAKRYQETLERFFAKTLERARRFVWSLTVPLPEQHPLLIVFGGDCHLTPARILVEEVNGESRVRMLPKQIRNPVADVDYERLLLEPGDRSVTKASLLGRNVLDPSVPRHQYSYFPLDHAVVLCEQHNSLTGNVSFQDNLLNALLVRD